jgi:carbon-monoxide dehydrogenase medium subunit
VLALGGELEITGAKGKRLVKADDFFVGLFETALGAQDILSAIRIPKADAQNRVGFAEFARRRGDYAMVGLAASARADGKGLADVRLAYFGVAATPLRAKKAEAALANGKLDAAIAALADDLDPQDDIQSEVSVKRHLAGVLLKRVALQLSEKRA